MHYCTFNYSRPAARHSEAFFHSGRTNWTENKFNKRTSQLELGTVSETSYWRIMARKLSHQRKNTFQISLRAESECGWTNSIWTCGRGKFLNPQRDICRFKSIRILVDRALDIPPPIVFIRACTKSKLCAFSRFLTDLSGTSDVKKDSYFHLLKTLSTFLCLSARLAHKATFFLSEIKCTKEVLLVPLALNSLTKRAHFRAFSSQKNCLLLAISRTP